jgi:hypothetical protein
LYRAEARPISGCGTSSLKPLSPHRALASPFFSSNFWFCRFHLESKFQESRASTSSAPRSPSRQSSPLKTQRAVVYSSSWSLVVHGLGPLNSHVDPLCLWLLPEVFRVANDYSMTFRICGVGYMDPGALLYLRCRSVLIMILSVVLCLFGTAEVVLASVRGSIRLFFFLLTFI